MRKNRLESLTDGVVAIILTIIVLELKVPEANALHAPFKAAPPLLVYALAFTNVALYWNNHHHVLQTADRIDGKVLWANMVLLFWLSLIPFAIRWMNEWQFSSVPVAIYGVIMTGSAIGYSLLQRSLIKANPHRPLLARAVEPDRKSMASLAAYVAAIGLAFVNPLIAIAIYVAIAVAWLVPDIRIERVLVEEID